MWLLMFILQEHWGRSFNLRPTIEKSGFKLIKRAREDPTFFHLLASEHVETILEKLGSRTYMDFFERLKIK